MMDSKSVAETLFEEEDEAFYSKAPTTGEDEAVATEAYNPKLSLAQLRAPQPDPDMDAYGKQTLVVVEDTFTEGNFHHTSERYILTDKPEEILLTSGPNMVTRYVRSKLLTAAQVKAYRDIVGE